MESEPPPTSQTRHQLQPIPEDKDFSHEIQDHPQAPIHVGSSNTCNQKPGPLHRCKTAPAMAKMRELQHQTPQVPKPEPEYRAIIRQAFFLFSSYLIIGVSIYYFFTDQFSGIKTHPVVDGLYFSIVTMCTIGYGDIAPTTAETKIFACFFVFMGFGFIGIWLSRVLHHVLVSQEKMLMADIQKGKVHPGFAARNYIVDVEKGRMRIRMKIGLALGVVVLCIGVGTLALHFIEDLGWVDSFYLSVMSVTTVGYGDRAFKTLYGRLFATAWLLISTIAVGRSFMYLTEYRFDKRAKKIVNWELQREVTVKDLLAADTNQNGYISKSEFVIYKLKEMDKIEEKDILQICDRFKMLDTNKTGKIRLYNLVENQIARDELM